MATENNFAEFRGNIFVSGPPRSGTTLLEIILSSHSGITITPETNIFEKIFNNADYYEEELQRNNCKKLFSAFLQDDKLKNWPGFDVETFIGQIEHDRTSFYTIEKIFNMLFASYAETKGSGKKYLGNKKGFYASNCAYVISRIFPDCKFIFIIRDPRDVIKSILVNLENYTFSTALLVYHQRVKKIREISLKLVNKCLLIKYENLVNQPQAVIAEMCRFLDIPPEEQMLHFHELNKEKNLLLHSTKNIHQNTLAPFNKKLANQWQRQNPYSFFKLLVIEAVCNKHLKEFGYPVTYDIPFPLDVAAFYCLKTLCIINRFLKLFYVKIMNIYYNIKKNFTPDILSLNLAKFGFSFQCLFKGRITVPILQISSNNKKFIQLSKTKRTKLFEIDTSVKKFTKEYTRFAGSIFPALIATHSSYIQTEWIYGTSLADAPFNEQATILARLLGTIHSSKSVPDNETFIHLIRLQKRLENYIHTAGQETKLFLLDFFSGLKKDYGIIEGYLETTFVHPDLISSNVINNKNCYYVIDNEFFYWGKGKEFDIINTMKSLPVTHESIFLEEYGKYADIRNFYTYRSFWEKLYLLKKVTKYLRFRNNIKIKICVNQIKKLL